MGKQKRKPRARKHSYFPFKLREKNSDIRLVPLLWFKAHYAEKKYREEQLLLLSQVWVNMSHKMKEGVSEQSTREENGKEKKKKVAYRENFQVALKITRRHFFYRHIHAKTQTYSEKHVHTRLHVFMLSSLLFGWFSTDSPSAVDRANRKHQCVLIYQWGKTATLATTQTHTNIPSLTHIHKVLRNVELINTPTHKGLWLVLLLFIGTKTPCQDLTFKAQRHAFTHSPLRGRVPWKLSLPQTSEHPVDLRFYPPTEPHWQQHTSFLFVSFVQLFSSVPSPQHCQLKTCVSCYNTVSAGPMHFGSVCTYQRMHAQKHAPACTHQAWTYVYPTLF